MSRQWCFIVWGLLFASPGWAIQVEQHGRHVVSIPNASHTGNPFELGLDATFTHSATGTQLTLPGYYDGNDTWKVAFMPTKVGQWSYQTSSSDPDLDGKTGTIDVTSSTHPGMLVADPTHPNKWKYTHGPYVVPIGLFASAMLDDASDAEFAAMADFLVQNNLQMINFRLSENDKAFSDLGALRMDLTLWQRLERRMEVLAERGLGIDLMLYTDDSGKPSYGPMAPAEKLLIRYMIARLASFPVVNFNTGIDIHEYRDQAWVNWYGQQVRSLDPYGHPVSSRCSSGILICAKMVGQTYHSLGEPFSNLVSLLRGYDPSDGVPAMNNDNWSEARTGLNINAHTPADIRRAGWKALIAGGVGFHVRHDVLNCVGGITECDRYFDIASIATQLDSEQWLRLVNPFVQNRLGQAFGQMEPAPALVSATGGKWALADSARSKILYFLVGSNDGPDPRDGGPIRLLLGQEGGGFDAIWFNPRTGAETSAGTLAGGQDHTLTPASNDDWILLLSRQGASPSRPAPPILLD